MTYLRIGCPGTTRRKADLRDLSTDGRIWPTPTEAIAGLDGRLRCTTVRGDGTPPGIVTRQPEALAVCQAGIAAPHNDIGARQAGAGQELPLACGWATSAFEDVDSEQPARRYVISLGSCKPTSSPRQDLAGQKVTTSPRGDFMLDRRPHTPVSRQTRGASCTPSLGGLPAGTEALGQTFTWERRNGLLWSECTPLCDGRGGLSRVPPAQGHWCLPLPRPGGPFLHPPVTFSPPLLQSRLTGGPAQGTLSSTTDD